MLSDRRPSLPSVVPFTNPTTSFASSKSPGLHSSYYDSDDSDDDSPALETPRNRILEIPALDGFSLPVNSKAATRADAISIDEAHLVPLSRKPSSVAWPESLRPSTEVLLEYGALSVSHRMQDDTIPASQADTVDLDQYLQEKRRLVKDSPSPIVLVVGVGYVGEQLVSAFSNVYKTYALDLSPTRRKFLDGYYAENSNVTVIGDIRDSPDAMNFDLALISVPTLLRPDCKSVDTSHIDSAVSMISQYAKPFSTVVVESSVTVGMTRSLLSSLRERQVFVGFSPERVDPGRVLPVFEEIPKVLSGIDEDSLTQVHKYYDPVFARTVPVKSLETAEFTKLFENCQRLMLISYVNEMADACAAHGVDIFDVCDAASTKPFGYSPFTPSLGAGGHCIPVNPWYLLSNCNLPLLRQAAESNRDRALDKAQEIGSLAKKVRSLEQDPESSVRVAGRVLVYGVGFKKGSDCLSYSPSVVLVKELMNMGVDVSYADAAVSTLSCPRFSTEDIAKRVPRGIGEQSILDATFDVIVVAHKPDAVHRAAFDSLQRCQVVYFSR